MVFDFPLYSIVFFIGGALALYFTAIYWRRRPAPGALPFALFALACGIWTLAAGLESGAAIVSTKFFWSKVEYIGAALSGVFWLVFALEYTGSRWWRRFPFAVPLWLFPLVTVILTWTNDLHHLVWIGSHPALGGSYFILIYEHGPWFWFMVTSLYLLFVSGIVVLWRFIYRKPGIFRWQIAMLTIGTLVPLAGSIIYLLDLSPIQGLDVAPFTFSFAGLIYAITIFRFRFLDVVPLARVALVENLPDGILVLNSEDRIVDMNPAVEKIIGLGLKSLRGKRLDQVWTQLYTLMAGLETGRRTELLAGKGGREICLEASVTPLFDKKSVKLGGLIVLRDVTERKKIEQSLRETELRYEALVEQSNEGVLIAQDGFHRYANRTIADITGYSVEEIVGQPVDFLVVDSEKGAIKEYYQQRVTGKEAGAAYEARLKRKDGNEVDVEVSVGDIRYEGQTANIVTIRDITDRKLTQNKLKSLYVEERRLRNSLQEEIDKNKLKLKNTE